jgi:FkbM family methyltransferase
MSGRNWRRAIRARVSELRLRLRLWQPFPIRLPWGAVWYCCDDVVSRRLCSPEGFEPDEQQFLIRFLRQGMTFMDIGAHHGLYTLLASMKVGPAGRVIAFEPSPRERKRLELHVRANRCANVTIEPFALADIIGSAGLYVCQGHETGCNSLRPPDVEEKVARVEVSMTTLDEYLRAHSIHNVDFIKMDAEGAELNILKGATALLAGGNRPLILVEIADIRTRPWGYRGADLYAYLRSHNYDWFAFTIGSALNPTVDQDEFHSNLVAVPREKLHLIREAQPSSN